MSLLSSRALQLDLGPHGLQLARAGEVVHASAQVLALDALPAALDALPEAVTPRRAALSVGIDNAWVRWQVIDIPSAVSGRDERAALVRARMAEVFGSAAQGWAVAWDDRPASTVLACALDAGLLQRLQAWAVARGLKLASVQPAWLRGYAALRGDAVLGGYAELSHGWLCLGLWSGGRWLHVRGEAMSDPAGLSAVLERRLAAFDGELQGGRLFLRGMPAVSLPRGWQCVAGAAR